MSDYAAMNKVCEYKTPTIQTLPAHETTDVEMINDPKPARTCVCVAELPFRTDVPITSHA
jgi:hypothetical protein